jgi:NADPH-dependent curcumin reductase CurA
MSLLVNRASMKGMVVFDYKQYYPNAIADYMKWTKAGLIKSKTDTYEGIENFNKTFLRLFSGDKIGKLILKIND